MVVPLSELIDKIADNTASIRNRAPLKPQERKKVRRTARGSLDQAPYHVAIVKKTTEHEQHTLSAACCSSLAMARLFPKCCSPQTYTGYASCDGNNGLPRRCCQVAAATEC